MNVPSEPGGGSQRGDAARVRCLYCGANNFPASVTCWQCGRPLKTLQSVPTPSSAVLPASSSMAVSRATATDSVNPALAQKAAAALGLVFPPIALPVGIVFLMLDDPRKAQLGWITIGWSVLGTVLNIVALLVTLGPTLAVLKGMLPATGHGLPGVPPMPSADPDGANIIIPYLLANLRATFII